jgi:ATP-dependent Lon protease
VPRFRYGAAEFDDQVGVVTGLAWTEVGGELLTIEGVMMPGKGKMTDDRQPARRDEGIDFGGGVLCPLAGRRFRGEAADVFDKRDIHVHVPEGATPKDGPSAGVAMATAIVSV